MPDRLHDTNNDKNLDDIEISHAIAHAVNQKIENLLNSDMSDEKEVEIEKLKQGRDGPI